MKRIFMQFAAVFLAVVLALPAAWAAGGGDEMVRVGLAYGSGALVSANLENNTGYGSGYRLGYFDENLDFVELAQTEAGQTQITMVKTQNVWVNGSSCSTTDNGGEALGCYHVLVGEDYGSYRQAAEAAAGYPGGFVAWINGSYQVRAGAYLTQGEADTAAQSLGGTVVGTSSYGVNVIPTGSAEILFQFDGGADLALGVMPDVTGADAVRTWFKGNRYYGGFRYERIGGGNLTVVNLVDLETYIKGVIPYEMSNDWPLEALKVQAVCARSYAYVNITAISTAAPTLTCATPPSVRCTTERAPTPPTTRPTSAPTGRWRRRRGSTPGMMGRSLRPSTPPATGEPARACTTCGAPLWRSTPTCAAW